MARKFVAPKTKIAPAAMLPPTSEKPAANPYGVPDAALPYVQPQLNLIQSQEDAQRKALSEFTNAILAELQKQAPAIGNDYNTAIGQSQALAQAGADSLKNANGNAGIQSILQSAGAPESQQQQVATNLGNVFGGGSAALFGSQGVFPGQQLITDKASAQAFANQLPGINALAGTAALKNLLAGGDAQRQKVLADVPSILADIEKQKATQAYQNSQLGLSQQRVNLTASNQKRQAANDAFGEWAKTQSLKQGAQRLNNQQAAQSFDQWAKQQGLKVQWANVDLSNRRLVLSQNKPPQNKPPRFTPQQIQTYKATAAHMAQATFWGTTDKNGKLHPPLTYQQAMSEIQGEGVPLNIAQQALNRYWRRPGFEVDVQSRIDAKRDPSKVTYDRATGGRGRPLKTYQQRSPGKGGAAAETAASNRALAATSIVKEYLGTPYVWGGSKPGGFDCSGLLQYVWGKEGVSIPRVTYDQWKSGAPVAKNSLQPGDAVFFEMTKSGPGHVGMYIGGGQFIEAPHTGSSVRISNLTGRSDYVGARRFG